MVELADSPPLVARLGDRARRFAEGLTWERTAAADREPPERHHRGLGHRLSREEHSCRRPSPPVTAKYPRRFRERAITVVERLGNLAPRPMEMIVVFDTDGLQQTVELRLHVARGEILVATGEGADHRTALDRAEEKLRRQVERVSDRPAAPGRRSPTRPPLMLRLGDFLSRRGDPLQLEALTGDLGLDRQMPAAEVAGPGLALAGYTGRFAANRLHVLGETEITYLDSRCRRSSGGSRWPTFFSFDLPCIFVTKGQEVPAELIELARAKGVPVLRSKLKTAEFYRRIKPIVEEAFAPRTTLHGSLADVYGVGLLFVGRSGIGKSECVLDLVERGHRLVADDVVQVTRRGNDVLIGRGHELAAHHMEIRGHRSDRHPGAVRGARGPAAETDRGGGSAGGLGDGQGQRPDRTRRGRRRPSWTWPVPRVVVPLNPGKNITVISEVVAMMHLLRYSGVDVAAAFNARLIKRMKEQRGVREYLQEDYE